MLTGIEILPLLQNVRSFRNEPRTKEIRNDAIEEMVSIIGHGLFEWMRKSLRRNELRDEVAKFFIFKDEDDNEFMAEVVSEALVRYGTRKEVDLHQMRVDLSTNLSLSRYAGMSGVKNAARFLSGDKSAFKRAA
ncbi:MAG: hypothetical protein QG654_367 [Patescibacteria group bacterium]|nr:hypothetical protein [Patescibacteria group bacterium]